jgi:CTP:molybdopterin cytidylyltransferase MocA
MGAQVNKVLLPLAGRPVLAQTLDRFESHPSVGRIVVVAGSAELELVRRMVSGLDSTKVVAVVSGGATGTPPSGTAFARSQPTLSPARSGSSWCTTPPDPL